MNEGIVWAHPQKVDVKELFKGIRLRTLWREGASSAQIVEFDPGSCWEGQDVHAPGSEEVYVVSGIFNDGVRDYPAGSFVHNPAGSWHVPQSRTGCVLFLFNPAP